MAKHRDLASVVYASTLGSASASKIWRTVVFAGAMLVTPMGCGGGSKPAPVEPAPTQTETPATTPATMKQDDAAAKQEADNKAKADAAAMEAEKKAAEEKAAKEEADKKAAEEMAAKEEADKKAAEEAAKKKRPRGGGKTRPTGRGFILS